MSLESSVASIESAQSKSPIEIDAAILNFFDKAFIQTFFWSMADIQKFLQKTGYEGVEWHPLRAALVGQQVQLGLLSHKQKEIIRSLHQSFRTEKSWAKILKHPSPMQAAASYILLPETYSSLPLLQRLQARLGKQMPIVTYPSAQTTQFQLNHLFAEQLFQPTAEVLKDWEINKIADLPDKFRQNGYTGLCLDLFHWRRQPSILLPWQETLPLLLPYIKEIHLAVGRTDISQRLIDSEQELRDLITGQQKSEIWPILSIIRQNGWQGRIVTEIPAVALRAFSANPTSWTQFQENHRRLVANVRNFFIASAY